MRTLTILAIALLVSPAAMAGGREGGGGRSSSAHSSAYVATGLASGKRQHKPIKVVKEWGAASPMLRGQKDTNRKSGRYLAR